MKKRESMVIYMEILASLFGGPKGPTRLAQACNINYGRLEGFTGPLVDKGLVSVSKAEGQDVYSITGEGYKVYSEWLEIWRKLPLEMT